MKTKREQLKGFEMYRQSVSSIKDSIKNIKIYCLLIYRMCFFTFCTLNYISLNFIIQKTIQNPAKKRKYLSIVANFSSKLVLSQCNIQCQVNGKEWLQSGQHYLVASNHMGYLDIILMQSVFKNNCFISHRNNGPILTLISDMNNNYMINTANIHSLRKEIRETAEILKQKTNLIFFPQGTSTDGVKEFNFHAPFFYTALLAKTPLLPVCINYISLDNQPFSKKNKDIICWHSEGGEQGFFPHLLKLIKINSIKVSVTILPPISYDNKTTRQLARESREQIQKHFHPPM